VHLNVLPTYRCGKIIGNFRLPNRYIIVERIQQSKQRNFEEKKSSKMSPISYGKQVA
jgi:hypothetical protein